MRHHSLVWVLMFDVSSRDGGYIEAADPEDVIEAKKNQVSSTRFQIGLFSRFFVDHGQSICGSTPDCGNCYLNKACPSAFKYMDW